MTKYFIDLLGKEFYNNLPTLRTEDVKVGSTMYLDQTRNEQFGENTIIKGVDRYRREFVSFRVHLKNNEDEKKYIMTMFNRYSDNTDFNVICKSHYSMSKGHLMDGYLGSVALNNDTFNKLKRLFDNYKDDNKKETITFRDGFEEVTYEIGLY
jgi:hypothetical protein